MEELEEKIKKLREQLNNAKRVCEITYRFMKKAKEEYCKAKEVYQNDLTQYEELDRQLAELDGRLKVITKERKKKEKEISLTSQQARNLLVKLKGMMKC